LFNGV